MSSLASYIDCLFPHLDPRLRSCFEKTKDDDSYYSDDDSSEYYEDDDDDESESDLEESTTEFEEETMPLTEIQNAQAAQVALNQVRNSNVLKSLEGRMAAFQGAMRRGASGDISGNVVIAHQTSSPTVGKGKPATKPKDVLKQVLESMGCNAEVRSYKTLINSYFVKPTPEQIAAYDMTLMSAVRSNDLDKVRELWESGKDLQCCNQFGESILHTVGRRGLTEMLLFLMNEAGVSLKVCCESGRNPMHDACWTSTPNFDCIRIILTDCPDFMLIGDNRNFVPLDYVPRDAWPMWGEFLQEHKDMLRPKVLV